MHKIIELCGKQYKLYYTVNSMCAVEERAGKPISEILDREFSAARILLWGGLLEYHPDITLKSAGDIIGEHMLGGGSLAEVIDLCAEAMQLAGFFGQGTAIA